MTTLGILVILVLKFTIGIALGPYSDDCDNALGMQSGAIHDDWIDASSSYDEPSVGPKNGRLKTERNGGAWCPKNQISRTVYEWLEVDLQTLHRITSVETQGRFGNGQGQEYAEAYTLQYQRVDGEDWIQYQDKHGEEVFPGNENTYLTVQNRVDPAIIARKIRIVPYSTHPRTVCMRVEVYGCKWKYGIMSYSMHQGERRGSELDLYDFTHDGTAKDGYLSGGLGQLVDGEEGHWNFRLDPQETGMKGYEWVGWKNESIDTPPVKILFEFDSVRNFSEVRLHANNMFSKDVRVFRMAKIYFSVGGKYYQKESVGFDYMRDTLIEYSRQVIIPIPHRIGRFCRIELYFDARWLMISEVRFDSEIAKSNFSEEVPPNVKNNSGASGNTKVSVITEETSKAPPSEEHKPLDDQLIGIIIGALAAMIILLLTIVAFCILRSRRHKFEKNKQVVTMETPIAYDLNDLRALANGKLSHGNMYNPVGTQDEGFMDPDHMTLSANGKLASANGGGTLLYTDTLYSNGIQTRKLPELPGKLTSDSGTDTVTSTYAVPDMTNSTFTPKVPPKPTVFSPNILMHEDSPLPPPPPPHPRALYAASSGDGSANSPQLQGFSGASHYAVSGNMELLWKEELSVNEFSRHQLQFVEQLGEGQFGEVHLCEAANMTEMLGDDFLVNRTGGSQSMLVAVKILRPGADDIARSDFHKEVKVMSKLKDPNIVLLLGVCTQDEPLCMIVEYMKYGDLNQYLQQHVQLESTIGKNPNMKCLSYGCLIYMATQIASGMKYLETLNMVHRDLATRNCLVGSNSTIKISDFGMSRGLYSSDYYRIEGKAMLPIRWMAWESVLLGKFSTKSDVWSFAVTLWEVLTMAREQPLDQLSDEQVIDNCGAYYRNSEEDIVLLPPPQNCPKEIFDLMCECWNRDDGMRPAFREIHMFLQRKNMGYNPREERGGMAAAGPGGIGVYGTEPRNTPTLGYGGGGGGTPTLGYGTTESGVVGSGNRNTGVNRQLNIPVV